MRSVLAAVRSAGAALLGAGRSSSGHRPIRWLKVDSTCSGSLARFAEPDTEGSGRRRGGGYGSSASPGHTSEGRWRGFCACCKRPLTISFAEPQPRRQKRRRGDETRALEGGERCAYVVAIWGSNAEYVLGAMVLGKSLRTAGAKHELVAMHTSDVPGDALEFLRRAGWTLRKVEYVQACDNLYQEYCLKTRFADVFTKLRIFELVEYSKVLLLDADLLVRENIDDLFDLPAPAAMARGPWSGYDHGEPIEGQFFFSGSRGGPWSWGQSGGINAGVMLLEPSLKTLQQCLLEVQDPLHPEHVRGNGPEQDYLSRYFASEWTHIDVAYNFQLHQMYFALSPTCMGADRTRFLDQPELIKVFHYSSEPKPWARYLDSELGCLDEEAWCHEMKRNFMGYRAWVLKDPFAIKSEVERNSGFVAVGPDGLLRKVLWNKGAPLQTTEAGDPGKEAPMKSEDGYLLGEVLEASESAIQAAEELVRTSMRLWDEAYRELATELGEKDLASAVRGAMVAPIPEQGNGEGISLGQRPLEENGAKEEWKAAAGWWLETPLSGRAVASCGLLPAPYATLSLDRQTLLSSNCEGLHVAAVGGIDASCPPPRSFAADNGQATAVAEWASRIPDGATVLLAIIDSAGSCLGEALAALAEAGLGCPAAPPPPGYVAMAAVGRKGVGRWHSTHAGAEVALATGLVRPVC